MFANDLLKERAVLVTGGGSGLGRAMALRFATLGASVALCGRTEERLAETATEIERQGGRAVYEVVDVRDYDAVGKMLHSVVAKLGKLTDLVNNAAGNFYCASEDLTPNAFKTVVDIVLHGTFNCTQHFGRYLIDAQRGGSILNIETTYTEHGSAFVLPSACAKAGVHALTTSLAYEWAAYDIRVNSIAPGPFPTEGAWARLIPSANFEEQYRSRMPLKRFGRPDEVANLAAYLLSDLAAYITGETVVIDGGERLLAGQFNFLDQLMSRTELKALFGKMKAARKSSS